MEGQKKSLFGGSSQKDYKSRAYFFFLPLESHTENIMKGDLSLWLDILWQKDVFSPEPTTQGSGSTHTRRSTARLEFQTTWENKRATKVGPTED